MQINNIKLLKLAEKYFFILRHNKIVFVSVQPRQLAICASAQRVFMF